MPEWSVSFFWFALVYQLPALLLGVLLRLVVRHPLLQAVFLLPGTVVHEFLHWLVGALLNGRPVSLSLWPRRAANGQWVLGSVGFLNVRWYNAVFIGLAPLLAVGVVLLLAPVPPVSGWRLQVSDWQRWLFATPVLAMCLPSSTDLRLALRSWPLLLALVAVLGLRYYV